MGVSGAGLLVAPAAAAEAGPQPEAGRVYAGRAGSTPDLAKVGLVAIGAVSGSGTRVRIDLALDCKLTRSESLVDTVTSTIGADGTFRIRKRIGTILGGGGYSGEVRLRGSFVDATTARATIAYDISEDDDDGTVVGHCSVDGMPIALHGGPVEAGLGRIVASVPIRAGAAPSERSHGVVATSADAVYVALRSDLTAVRPEGSTLVRVDPTTNQEDRRSRLDQRIDAMVVIGDSLWGVDSSQGLVVRIDPETLRVRAVVQVTEPPSNRFDDLALWPQIAVQGDSLWLSATLNQELVRFDTTTGAVGARYPIGTSPKSIAAGAGSSLYVATEADDRSMRVLRVDSTTGEQQAETVPILNLRTVFATATDVFLYDASVSTPLSRLDPVSLAVVATATKSESAFPLVTAPPGFWGERDGTLVAFDPASMTIASKVRGLQVPSQDLGDPTVQFAAAGFNGIWVWDEGQTLLFRVGT